MGRGRLITPRPFLPHTCKNFRAHAFGGWGDSRKLSNSGGGMGGFKGGKMKSINATTEDDFDRLEALFDEQYDEEFRPKLAEVQDI